jgi:hypothetical protein
MPPTQLVRQSLRAMKVVEEEPEGGRVEGDAYISAGTGKGSGHHRSVSSFAGEFVWDPDYDNGPSPTTMTRVSISILIRASETRNRYQIIVDRRRPWFPIPDTFWFFVRDLKSTLGGRASGCSITTTTTHASVEGWDGLVGGGAWSRQGNVDVYAS